MRWILSTALILTIGSTAAAAQTDTAATGWMPALEVRGVPAATEGSAQVLGDRKLVKGEPIAVTIWTGRSLCHLGIGNVDSTGKFGVPSNIWRMTGDYLGEQNGRHQVRVTSGFTRLGGNDTGATTTQTLSLREGEGDSIILDAIIAPLDSTCPVHVVTLEARLVMQATNPELARARYAADLWLVHRDPQGREQREHLVTNVSAGAPAMPFIFNPLTFAIPQLDARQGSAAAVIRLSGSLRVRPRADGAVSIDLDVNRPLFGLETPDKPGMSAMPPNRMTLSVNNGETAAVDFPAPSSGFSAIALATGSAQVRATAGQATSSSQPTDAVQVKNDKLVLYTFQFFKGHSTRLLITLKRLP